MTDTTLLISDVLHRHNEATRRALTPAEKIRAWWSDDGQWFCVMVNDGVSCSTVSLTPAEGLEFLGRANAATARLCRDGKLGAVA